MEAVLWSVRVLLYALYSAYLTTCSLTWKNAFLSGDSTAAAGGDFTSDRLAASRNFYRQNRASGGRWVSGKREVGEGWGRGADSNASSFPFSSSSSSSTSAVANNNANGIYSRRLPSGETSTDFKLAGLLSKRDATASSLHELASRDPISVVLKVIEQTRRQGNCTRPIPLKHYNKISKSSFDQFHAQTLSALKTANILNNLFRPWESKSSSSSLYNDAFYYSLVRALIEHDDTIIGGAIAFDPQQYNGGDFCPSIYRDKRNRHLHAENLATSSKSKYYANGTEGYEWFVKQRNDNFSRILWGHLNLCDPLKIKRLLEKTVTERVVETTEAEGKWTAPYYDCTGSHTWKVTYSVPFFGCRSKNQLQFKGVVAIHVDLEKLDINQCPNSQTMFANTHRCRSTTECIAVPHMGFQRGSYRCVCEQGYYYPDQTSPNSRVFNGSDVEESYLRKLLNTSNDYDDKFQCLPCREGCKVCNSGEPCYVDYNILIRGVPLGIQSFCMTITLVLGFVILKIRKSKVMKASMWVMVEIILLGALLIYSTVVILYFEPTTITCLLMPWFREIGFAIVYGALILKVYRVLAEFQSRKAHRVHVRDRDLLKYLLGIVLVVTGYMSAWTAVNMDHVHDGDTMIDTGEVHIDGRFYKYTICKAFWWDYVIEVGEFLFLCFGIYLCYCIRAAPSDYSETRYVSWAIYNETVISALLHIIRHVIWLSTHPDYIFLMYFLRCQLTVTIALLLVLGPKLWYAHRPPGDDTFRNRAYSTSDVHDTILPESMKLHVGVSSNGDVDVGEINLSEMDPEDIRAELKRLYTQLQICKTKTMRKDNPHITKRRGGRKPTRRRFSLQAFHYKHRHHHDHDHDHELSKTPEESTNSAEGVAIQMEASSCGGGGGGGSGGGEDRTPTVTFKPGHKSFS